MGISARSSRGQKAAWIRKQACRKRRAARHAQIAAERGIDVRQVPFVLAAEAKVAVSQMVNKMPAWMQDDRYRRYW